MGLVDLQLAKNVLGCVIARARRILGGVFLQSENVVGLRAGDDRVLVFDRANNVSHRTAAADAPAINRAADERQIDRIEARQVIASRHRLECLRRNARGNFGDDFVSNKASFARRWHAAAAGASTSDRQLRGKRRPERGRPAGADDRVPWASGVVTAPADRPAAANNAAGILARREVHRGISGRSAEAAHAAETAHAAKPAHAECICRT